MKKLCFLISKYWVFFIWVCFIPVVVYFNDLEMIDLGYEQSKESPYVAILIVTMIMFVESLIVFFALKKRVAKSGSYFNFLIFGFFVLCLTNSFPNPTTMLAHTVWLFCLLVLIMFEFVLIKIKKYTIDKEKHA